jgi:4-amino-4-deoxy-L-arabinose transferase-like glycosyltransferase
VRLRLSPLAAVLILAGLHMALFDRGLGGDGWASFATLEALADRGSPFVEGENHGVMNGLVRTPEGRWVLQYPPGILALDALPFLAGRTLDGALPAGWMAQGAELPPAGRVPRGVFLSAAMIVLARNVATLLGLVWIVRALRRMGISERSAAAAAALAFFGGPLLFYSLVGMSHAPAFALAALLLLVLVRQREDGSVKLALAAGAIVGAAVLVRYGSIALAAPAVLAIGLEPGRPGLDRPGLKSRATDGRPSGTSRNLLAFAAGLVMALAPIVVWWEWLFGSWRPPYGGTWVISAASPWNVLFSPVHGLFLFHPALLLAATGLTVAAGREIARRTLGWSTIAAIWFFAVAILYGWWSEWSNPGGYGQRFLIDALPALAVGFAGFLEGEWQRLRAATVLGMAMFGYLLFFAAVGGLVPAPPGLPWPQRLSDYAPLIQEPPGPAESMDALRRASLPARAVFGPAR